MRKYKNFDFTLLHAVLLLQVPVNMYFKEPASVYIHYSGHEIPNIPLILNFYLF